MKRSWEWGILYKWFLKSRKHPWHDVKEDIVALEDPEYGIEFRLVRPSEVWTWHVAVWWGHNTERKTSLKWSQAPGRAALCHPSCLCSTWLDGREGLTSFADADGNAILTRSEQFIKDNPNEMWGGTAGGNKDEQGKFRSDGVGQRKNGSKHNSGRVKKQIENFKSLGVKVRKWRWMWELTWLLMTFQWM